ncbi:MAG: hypothetical protein RL738_751 [Bacteroidota bacterium]
MDGVLGRRLNFVSLGALVLFLGHQVALAYGASGSWFDSYLDPLCTVPVVLGVPSMLARGLSSEFRLSWMSVFAFTALLSVAFEVWIPRFDARFTADIWDAAAYVAGALLWRFVEPKGA